MSILRDMFTALKGGVSEAGEAIVDSQAIRIYEQNIREADQAIKDANRSLTKLKSREIQLKRSMDEKVSDIADWEAKVMEALEADNEGLAAKGAERIAELTEEHDSIEPDYNSLMLEVSGLNKLIQKRKRTLEKNRTELERVKTTEQIQKATASISSNIAATNSKSNRIKESLDRIKKKQQLHKDNMTAGEWLEEENDGDSLDKEFKDAGIGGSSSSTGANDVLARLKAKAGKK